MSQNSKKAGIIYTVRNKVTGQFYVGATTKNVKRRKLDHQERANRREGSKFNEAISTYGNDAFIWKEIDTASSIDELAQKEKQYIIKYNSKEKGYNSDSGGGIKKTIYKYNLNNGSLLSSFDSLEAAAKSIGTTKQQISKACLSVNNTFAGYYWSYQLKEPFNPSSLDKRRKQILQLSLDGKHIASFGSIVEASNKTGVNKTSIAKVCRKERKTAGNYLWNYI